MRTVLSLISIMTFLAGPLCVPAHSQGRNSNPNMRNFYMARQQIQITDDAPAVNDMRTTPGAPGQQQAPAAAPGQGLPKASFNTYMSGYAGGGAGRGLPQVTNGVPQSLPSAPGLTGKKASAGKLKPKTTKAAPVNSGPVVAKGYSPYARTPVQSNNGGGGGSGSMLNSSTNVQGSVLHWNKRH